VLYYFRYDREVGDWAIVRELYSLDCLLSFSFVH